MQKPLTFLLALLLTVTLTSLLLHRQGSSSMTFAEYKKFFNLKF